MEKSQDNYLNTLLDRAIREFLDCSLLFSLALTLSMEMIVCCEIREAHIDAKRTITKYFVYTGCLT